MKPKSCRKIGSTNGCSVQPDCSAAPTELEKGRITLCSGELNTPRYKACGQDNPRCVQRGVSTRPINELLAREITEKVARRFQELNGLYGIPASLNVKATIYHEALGVLEDGVEY